MLINILEKKAAKLVKFLGVRHLTKEPITKAEILNDVINEHKNYFTVIFRNIYQCTEVIFGVEVKEVDC